MLGIGWHRCLVGSYHILTYYINFFANIGAIHFFQCQQGTVVPACLISTPFCISRACYKMWCSNLMDLKHFLHHISSWWMLVVSTCSMFFFDPGMTMLKHHGPPTLPGGRGLRSLSALGRFCCKACLVQRSLVSQHVWSIGTGLEWQGWGWVNG
jgi:hypothetical protein